MLTINKPVQYGYRPVHDLPTPPSTSRPSPPLIHQDPGQKALFITTGGSSPSDQLMSAPHRNLPPPAALPPVQPPPGSGLSQPPAPPGLSVAPAAPPPPTSQSHSLGALPTAPSWHEESMKAWLVAKAEEDKRRQEEERTRQESYRLEQRRVEHEILRTSLQGGIPPPLVPVVFAGMGGGILPPAALEWAQQYMMSQSQQPHPPALMPPGPVSPEHQRRDSQAQTYGQYPTSSGVPSTPGSAQGPPSAYMSGYPGSPTRPRGQSMPGTMGGRPHAGGPSLPNLNTNVPGGPGSASGAAQHPGIAQSQQQQEPQPSPSIYFHHWQPPTTQAGGRSSTDQPATPSGESPRKRKATGPQQPVPPPSSSQRLRSPPFSHSTGLSNPPPGRRRGHSRQRSDLGSYRPSGRGRGETSGPGREMSPMPGAGTGASSARESGQVPSSSQPQVQQAPLSFAPPPPLGRTGAHSVSSLLSDNPHPSQAPGPSRQHHLQQQHQQQHHQSHYGEGERRTSPRLSEENMRSGGVPGSSATRPGDID